MLDLCAEVLHDLKAAERAYASRDLTQSNWTAADRAADEQLMHTYHDGIKRAAPPLRLVAKLPATTAAGIYAKAMVVRASATWAAGLAMLLAEDLVACEELRKMLWPAEVQ